jgi:hypothetical protein
VTDGRPYRSNNSDDEQIRDRATSQRLRKAANLTRVVSGDHSEVLRGAIGGIGQRHTCRNARPQVLDDGVVRRSPGMTAGMPGATVPFIRHQWRICSIVWAPSG